MRCQRMTRRDSRVETLRFLNVSNVMVFIHSSSVPSIPHGVRAKMEHAIDLCPLQNRGRVCL
jgi:hypothetical protein